MYLPYWRKHRFSFITALGLLLLIASTSSAADRSRQPQKVRLEQATAQRISPTAVTGYDSTCTASNDQGLYWMISGWVIGQELYKVLINPADSCPGAYPYTVHEIGIPLSFGRATQITIAVDIEAVDNSDTSCAVPGTLIGTSTAFMFDIPGPGLWDIWVPFDIPVTVNAPFFAGVYISNVVDPADDISLITDNFPVPCVTYNIWDTAIGFIDLTNNDFFNFPGRLVMYASVTPSDGRCCLLVGDLDHSGGIDISDLTFIIDFMFRGAASPICPEEGDVNGSGDIDISDLTHLIEFMFYQGPPPTACPF